MKKILLLLVLMLTLASCGTSKDYITVTGYEWKVTLNNGDYATGITQSEKEAKENIKAFAKSRNTKIKSDKVKVINRKIKKSKF